MRDAVYRQVMERGFAPKREAFVQHYGLRGSEGSFTICTFWYVEALARSGRLNEARLTFEKMFTYGSRLGLYSEEIAPTGEQVGNFPQAFSHLALINAAVQLDAQLTGADRS
jgi:GH15 family glucan-1,4-alpha-glucosidase